VRPRPAVHWDRVQRLLAKPLPRPRVIALAVAVVGLLAGLGGLASWANMAQSATTSLGRGISFGNILEAPTEGDWGLRLDEDLFVRAKEAGFDTIRLPVRWSTHAAPDAPYAIDEPY